MGMNNDIQEQMGRDRMSEEIVFKEFEWSKIKYKFPEVECPWCILGRARCVHVNRNIYHILIYVTDMWYLKHKPLMWEVMIQFIILLTMLLIIYWILIV